jgi:hypothetical protein
MFKFLKNLFGKKAKPAAKKAKATTAPAAAPIPTTPPTTK